MWALRLVLLAIVSAPLIVVLVAICLYKLERRALSAAVRNLGCPSCSEPLSEHSIQVADELWARHMATIMKQYPGVKLRIVRQLSAVCSACGARLRFDRASGTLSPISLVLAFETGKDDQRARGD